MARFQGVAERARERRQVGHHEGYGVGRHAGFSIARVPNPALGTPGVADFRPGTRREGVSWGIDAWQV
jgi:hypothetical protein